MHPAPTYNRLDTLHRMFLFRDYYKNKKEEEKEEKEEEEEEEEEEEAEPGLRQQ